MSPYRSAFAGATVAVLAFWASASARGQVKYPPRAEKLDVEIRYRIRLDRDERARQFRELTAHLDRYGFVAAPREGSHLDVLDPTAERFIGTIPSANVLRLLVDPRVQTVSFAPAGYKPPDDLAATVSVRIGLSRTNRSGREQRLLHRQAVSRLGLLGFREAVGYDTRGYELVRGALPYGNYFRLLKDLRGEPSGWFAADSPPDLLPKPLRDSVPVRWVEVLPETDFAPLALPPVAENSFKFGPELGAILADGKGANDPIRVEAVLNRADPDAIEDMRTRLRSSYSGSTVEGLTGLVLAVALERTADLVRFASEPDVSYVRLPRAASATALPATAEPPAMEAGRAVASMGLDRLHRLGRDGRGTRVVVLSSEFAGFEAQVGRGLPATARLIDLTAELSRTLSPSPADPARPDRGTAVALAAAAAAPAAEIVLVRVARDAFFQLDTVARFVRGDTSYSEAMRSRIAAIAAQSETVDRLKLAAVEEYRKAFADSRDDGEAAKRRDAAAKALQKLLSEQAGLAEAVRRYAALQDALKGLASGTTVLVNALVWESGYPADGSSAVSRSVDRFFAGDAMRSPPSRSATRPRPANAPLWVQAASADAGSVWGGPYLDGEGDGVMEFAPHGAPLSAGTWTRKLNFLADRAADGRVAPNLPGGARLRVTVQWRELHDPDVYEPPGPVFPLALRLLRQLDPGGEKRATDEMDEVARSTGPVARLMYEQRYAVYEQSLAVALPAEGRYALRVEGRTAFDARLPALRQDIEVHPRIAVEYLGATGAGRPVFASFAPPTGGVGIPGDAGSALTVDVLRAPGDPSPRLENGGPGTALRVKPDLRAPGSIAGAAGGRGSGVAAGYAAGLAACAIGAGAPSADLLRAVNLERGGPAELGEAWLKWVVPVSGAR